MEPFYKYLPVSNDDLNFGFAIANCGFSKTLPNALYPNPRHPNHHYFEYSKGRILEEFQLIYIVQGGGIFESKSFGKTTLREGSMVFLFPGEWHRYKPFKKTGWTEYWMGFTGKFGKHLLKHNYLNPQHPILQIGHNEEVIRLYHQIFRLFQEETIGYQQHVSGVALHLLGVASSIKAKKGKRIGHIEKIIARSKLILLEKAFTQITPEEVAESLNISYSWFRKLFKTYTSFSPKEYIIELRITRARQLLLTTNKPIKEICNELGFNSQYHFCKLFKKKTNLSPTEFRQGLVTSKI